MKKITLLITLLITAVSFGQNLIINGDFETGLTTGAGWDNGTANYSYGTFVGIGGEMIGSFTAAAPHGGTYYGYKKTWSESFIQGVDVSPGEKYIVQFWYYNSFTANSVSKIFEFNADVKGAALDLTPIVADTGANGNNATNYGLNSDVAWTEASYSFVVPAGITRIQFAWWDNNNALNFIDDVSMVLDPVASINDLEKFNFRSFPNPVQDNLQLSASKNIDNIEIYNILGQQVVYKELHTNRAEVNIANLSKGVYIIKVSIEDAIGTYKIIKE